MKLAAEWVTIENITFCTGSSWLLKKEKKNFVFWLSTFNIVEQLIQYLYVIWPDKNLLQ